MIYCKNPLFLHALTNLPTISSSTYGSLAIVGETLAVSTVGYAARLTTTSWSYCRKVVSTHHVESEDETGRTLFPKKSTSLYVGLTLTSGFDWRSRVIHSFLETTSNSIPALRSAFQTVSHVVFFDELRMCQSGR
jgi:hypothetical protein